MTSSNWRRSRKALIKAAILSEARDLGVDMFSAPRSLVAALLVAMTDALTRTPRARRRPVSLSFDFRWGDLRHVLGRDVVAERVPPLEVVALPVAGLGFSALFLFVEFL